MYAIDITPIAVYPRVGGGTTRPFRPAMSSMGLSPRGRGNRLEKTPPGRWAGSIPAWAGEPSSFAVMAGNGAVYPRVGGGTPRKVNVSRAPCGLSPRGRGNRLASSIRGRGTGSIPAWAGEPATVGSNNANATVYPRVGGGTPRKVNVSRAPCGLSPRGRGNRLASSIRGRGTGSIPAWAGEPATVGSNNANATVYPRVGGGTPRKVNVSRAPCGLSPRGRGNRLASSIRGRGTGSIPAWAGEPATVGSNNANATVYPRVGGGTL